MKKILLFLIIPLFLLYLVTSVVYPEMSNVVSGLYVFVISIFVFIEAKSIVNLKKTWYLFGFAALAWAITDMVWVYYMSFTSQNPDNMSLFVYLYLITDVILLTIIGIYFAYNISKWNRLQLLIDTLVITVITLALGSALFFSQMNFEDVEFGDLVSTVGYLSVDILIMVFVVTLIVSSRFRKIRLSIKYMAAGLIVYVSADLLYIDTLVTDKIFFAPISDMLFYGAFLMFALAAYSAKKDSSSDYNNEEEMPLNYGKSRILWWVLIVPLILFMTKRISITYLTSILLVLVIYQLISHYVQKLVLTDSLYTKEHELTLLLEKKIIERTSELEQSKKELQKRAITDSLTHLYNRDYFVESLNNKILSAKPFSIAYLDLDRFKVINDLYGHPMGDRVLVEVSRRLKNEMKTHYDIFRVGGDEFSIVINGDSIEALENCSHTIKNLMLIPIEIEGFQFTVDASIGFSRYPKDAKTVSDLVKNADIAMYHAKDEGALIKHVVFSSNLVEQIERRNHIEILLKNADFKNDFMLYYQPQFDAKTLEIIGMEALIRWHHKDEGFISPAEFIPIAEEVGLILDVNDFVFTEAMLQIKRWNYEYNQKLVMSVNLSPLTFNSVDFYMNLEDLIMITGVEASFIEFEITEHSAMNTSLIMEDVFKRIKELGFSISIDDFGTGYSSLSYLKRFNVDTLKIARELISNIEINEDEKLIVKAIIMMSNALGLHIIAEGVETKEQLELLIGLDCHTIQGYYLARPMSATDLENNYFKKGSKI